MVIDKLGNLFEDRRKDERRKIDIKVDIDKRKNARRKSEASQKKK